MKIHTILYIFASFKRYSEKKVWNGSGLNEGFPYNKLDCRNVLFVIDCISPYRQEKPVWSVSVVFQLHKFGETFSHFYVCHQNLWIVFVEISSQDYSDKKYRNIFHQHILAQVAEPFRKKKKWRNCHNPSPSPSESKSKVQVKSPSPVQV